MKTSAYMGKYDWTKLHNKYKAKEVITPKEIIGCLLDLNERLEELEPQLTVTGQGGE